MHRIQIEQKIPASPEAVWDFMSSPKNLKTITPDYMGFDILTSGFPEKMYPGMIIAYRVRPVLGIPMTWVTEITHVRAGEYFVDEQRIGPYRMWHHEHHLAEIPGGTLMTDIVSYQAPLGFLGGFANWLFIRRQLDGIFRYRWLKIEEQFGVWK